MTGKSILQWDSSIENRYFLVLVLYGYNLSRKKCWNFIIVPHLTSLPPIPIGASICRRYQFCLVSTWPDGRTTKSQDWSTLAFPSSSPHWTCSSSASTGVRWCAWQKGWAGMETIWTNLSDGWRVSEISEFCLYSILIVTSVPLLSSRYFKL